MEENTVKPTPKKIFRDFIVTKGLKSTRQRKYILEAFMALGPRISVDELYLKLRTRHLNIGYTTVYRTLKLFAEAGIAREVRVGDSSTRYEYVTEEERRDRIVCSRCGAITELENGSIGDILGKLAAGHGFTFENSMQELRGLCPRCRE